MPKNAHRRGVVDGMALLSVTFLTPPYRAHISIKPYSISHIRSFVCKDSPWLDWSSSHCTGAFTLKC